MILEEKFQGLVQDYCREHKIRIIDGKIPICHKRDIEDFIDRVLKNERAITRGMEKLHDMQVGNILNKMLGRIDVLNSPIEQYLWDALEREGLSYLARRQFDIGPYKIDMAFPIARLAVECDGAEYHRANMVQFERDQKRDKYLARKGWRTLRIEGIAIRRDINFCIKKIKDNLGDLAVSKEAVGV
jgi:very-short-patch-repair endonuclease